MFTMTFFLINLNLKLRGLPYSVWHEGTDAQWTFVTANFQCVAPALLIHMSMIWINVMSCVGLASGWRPSCMARNLTLDITCKLFNQFFHTCHAYKHHWLQPFYSPFTNLDIAWRSKDQCKENLMASFSRTLFNWSGWNFIWCWSKSSWTSWYYFWATFKGTREITAVLWTVSKTFQVGMLSDVYEWIWLQLGVMIDTVVLYMLILVWLTLTLIQYHRGVIKQKFLHQLISQSFQLIWMEGGLLMKLVYVMKLLLTYFAHSIFSGENGTNVLLFFKTKYCWLVYRHLLTDFFETWHGDRDYEALHRDINLDDLDLHSRSQLYEKFKILVSIFLEIYQFRWNSACCHNLLVCWSSC